MSLRDDAHDRWVAALTLDDVTALFIRVGAGDLLVKFLSERQDNSKNQIYLGQDLTDVSQLPSGEMVASVTASRKDRGVGATKYQAPMNLSWITAAGPVHAPETKIIY